MPTPPKPFTVLTTEKKSHRTKDELKKRQQGEAALSTGVAMKERPEVKAAPIAHKEFRRLNTLLGSIGKNDAIYETVINRYCLLLAECQGFEQLKDKCNDDLEELYQAKENGLIDIMDYFDKKEMINRRFLNYDKQLQTKRKMLFDIEKENIMTIAAALRSIPKKADDKPNPLLEALKGKKDNGTG